MTTKADLDRLQRLTILKLIARGREDLDQVAPLARAPADVVRRVAADAGWPDMEKVRQAAAAADRHFDGVQLGGSHGTAGPPAARPPVTARADSGASLTLVDVAQLRPNPRNRLRGGLGDLTGLTASIRAEGILQPLVVEPISGGAYRIVMGQRRHAAAKALRMLQVPCIIRAAAPPKRTTARMLIENLQREGLDPLDEADAYAELLESGMTRQDIARATGVSAATIASRLALLNLPAPAKAMVRDGSLTLSDAGKLARDVRRTRTGSVTPGEQCPPHFTQGHPLAEQAKTKCDLAGHPLRGRLGRQDRSTACGACWEGVVRADERATREAG